MSLSDDLVDAATRILGLRTEAEAGRQWPSIVAGLGRVRDRLKASRPHLRRNPAVDGAADWLRRSLADCPVVAEARKAEAEELVAEVKRLAGPSVPDWKPAPPTRRRPLARP